MRKGYWSRKLENCFAWGKDTQRRVLGVPAESQQSNDNINVSSCKLVADNTCRASDLAAESYDLRRLNPMVRLVFQNTEAEDFVTFTVSATVGHLVGDSVTQNVR